VSQQNAPLLFLSALFVGSWLVMCLEWGWLVGSLVSLAAIAVLVMASMDLTQRGS
jgi:hypothetical protein